jgi:hypothetical protein
MRVAGTTEAGSVTFLINATSEEREQHRQIPRAKAALGMTA